MTTPDAVTVRFFSPNTVGTLRHKATATFDTTGLRSWTELSFPCAPVAFAWNGAIHGDNAGLFTKENSRFWRVLLNRFEPAKRRAYEENSTLAAELLTQVMVGYLPEEIRREGLGNRKEEAALLSAVPGIITLDQGIQQGKIKQKWGLSSHLGDAVAFARRARRKKLTVAKLQAELDRKARQVSIGKGGLMTSLHPLGAMLGWALMKAADRADPASAMEEYLAPYIKKAGQDSPSQGGIFGGGMFGGGDGPAIGSVSPALTFANIMKVQIPRSFLKRESG